MLQKPQVTLRRTPTTSTTAVLGWSEEMSTILPGIARHIQVQVCNSVHKPVIPIRRTAPGG